jgi:hypothetical protein
MTEPTYVGPFRVPAGDPILPLVQEADALLDARFRPERGWFTIQSTKRPARAPKWSWGLRAQRSLWVNPRRNRLEKLYVILHEYAHGWDGRYGTPAMRQAISALMGTKLAWGGGYYKANDAGKVTSNRPLEGFADAFAKAMAKGLFDGLLVRTYTTNVSPAQYPAFLAAIAQLDKGGPAVADGPFPATPPSPTPESVRVPRHRFAYLRAWPGWAAPVIRVVGFGGQIATARGRIGAAWRGADGRPGAWWFRVVAVAGRSIQPALWVPGSEVKRPAATSPASSNQTNG